MANTKKELTKVLNALSGETHQEHEFNSKADIIAEISKHTSGGGGGSGEPEIFWINCEFSEDSETEQLVITNIDKTYTEICEAIEAGKYPIIVGGGIYEPFVELLGDGYSLEFANIIYMGGDYGILYVTIDHYGEGNVWLEPIAKLADIIEPIFYVGFVQSGGVYSLHDTTFNDIENAYNNGQVIKATINIDSGKALGDMFYISPTQISFTFEDINTSDKTILKMVGRVFTDNTVTVNQMTITGT